MAELLQHPALQAYLHADATIGHIEAVYDPDTQNDQWVICVDAVNKLREFFSMQVPGEVWSAYEEALAWGVRWEGIRSAWFSSCGRWADADDALARQHRLEREYIDETGEALYGH